MRLGQDVLSDLDAATGGAMAHEWLLTNALGGASSGTASGAHTRRSHALLLAPGPDGRPAISLLKLDERLSVGGESFDLGCDLVATTAPGIASSPDGLDRGAAVQARPAGHRLLEAFAAAPWPTWRWRAGGVVLERSLFTLHTHHAVAVTYRHLEGPPARLSVIPLLVSRSPDALQRVDDAWRGAAQAVPGRVCIETTAGGPAVSIWHGGVFMPARVWQRGRVYPAHEEGAPADDPRRRRGRAGAAPAPSGGAGEHTDAAFVPGYLECDLARGAAFHVVASTERDLFRALAVEGLLGAPPPGTLGECVALLERGERDRRSRWHRAAVTGAGVTARQADAAHRGRTATPAEAGAGPPLEAGDPWLARLSPALLDGLVERDGRLTLLTALPAGLERGSDTLRALPALVTLRMFDPAREVLRGYVEYLNEGLAPAWFDSVTQRPHYGDPAAALWLVHAAELLIRRSEDLDLLREHVLPAVESIVQACRAGTRHGVGVGPDALLRAGEGDAARCDTGDNVLWFHALVATAQLARMAGHKERAAFYLAWAREHQARVLETLWDARRGCLLESLGAPSTGVTARQILAVSLAPPLLPPEQAARLVASVERELLTPFGLRSSADAVTASPAWLGPFVTASLRVHQRDAATTARARGAMDALRAWLDERGAVHVPEAIAAPRRGDGAARRRAHEPEPRPALASVLAAAELLRAWVEEMDRTAAPAAIG